ncbi:S-layer family protein [Polynucleobacter sp. Fuers-14]|uniref:beta strand repeat-containing protein n=1 Tax=Polynucleobacter sp. Fuers-14 TaxID=1758364 RepID=UPI001C0CBC23|nr:YDG domain-containing protein [Polynucleobacter sp. Fuers-14]MBU3641713.1 filamentous hemagglutinin N-terminal domain-containing protein [Polynucleobacter sp. Fuers-14]
MTDRITQPSHRKHCTSQFKAAKLLAALAVAGLAQQGMAAAPAPNALPTGGQVVAGSATIATAGNTMNINQSSQRAVINWNSFDVGSKATVNFNQPNAQASTLNYVNGASKSMINGAVNANGQVVFVNNNGVVFGKGAEVNVGGMVATTMNISATEFMSGKDTQVYEGGTTGKIINKGHITGNNINSYIALMAPQVINTGVITATMSGNNAIALVAGQKVTLKFSGSQFVSVSVDASVVNALISNKLLINAGSGQVIIGANAAQNLMGSLIKNTGTISASDINTSGGKISLTADTIEQSGVIEANSAQAAGGNISLKGNNITVSSGSKTTATGATAGGTINVGVNNANNQTIQNAVQNNAVANTVSVQTNAIVDASATQNGNGGAINIWSQIKTAIAGNLFAKGGAQSGNGGLIETSSKGNVAIASSAVVDTSAPKGRTGMWTVDPMALIIDSAAASAISNALNTTSVILDATGSNSSACVFGSCTNSQSALIRIMAGADIYSSNTATSLNLIATGGQIDINSNITAGSVYAVAQAINVNGSINTNGGSNSNIYLAGAIINILGNINSNGSNSSNSSNNSNNTNSNNLNSANTITGANRRNGQNGLTADANTYSSNGGTINILSTGDINISANSYLSANGVNGGVVTIASTGGNINNNGIVDALGKQANGGNIMIAGANQTNLIGSLMSSEGLNVGGMINLGQINNLGNGTILAPPATAPPALITFVQDSVATVAAATSTNSITSSNINIDSQTGINAPNGNIVVFGDQIQINNSSITALNGTIAIGRPSYGQGALATLVTVSNSTLIANQVETSGDLLGTDNNKVTASEWLLDPNNVTIAAGTTTGGTLPNYIAGLATSNVSIADIQTSINAGTSVKIAATGTITQAAGSALTFNIVSGKTSTLTFDTTSGAVGTGTNILFQGGITSTGPGTLNLNLYSNGQITVSVAPAISSTNGKINISMQSFYTTNSTGWNIILYGGIATRGGFLSLDTTGGTIDATTGAITRGSIKAGGIEFNSTSSATGLVSTTTDGAVIGTTTTGGAIYLATGYTGAQGSVNLTANTTINGGSTINMDIVAGTVASAGYGYVSPLGSALNAYGNITITSNSLGTNNDISPAGSTSSYRGSVSFTANDTISINGSIWLQGPVSAYNGITLSANASGATNNVATIRVESAGTLTSTNGTVAINSAANDAAGIYAVSVLGLITAPQVLITATDSTAAGLGVQVKGGVTITAGTYTDPGDAFNITSTVGTAGLTGGISVITGPITNNSNGGNVSFITNGDITATAAVNFATANTTNHAQTLTYDTRTGNLNSQITTGTFTYNTTGTQPVNYVEESNGSNLTIGATAVSGYITVDNTNSGALTPASTATNMTTLAGVTATGNLSAGNYIYLNGLNDSATVAGVALGASTFTVSSASTATSAIRVIGNHNAANKGATGITSTGTITDNANGGAILFQSNAAISQTGAVTVAANTTGIASSITYDTTSGTSASSIASGALTLTGTASASNTAINYIEKAAGATITVGAISMPGYILLDNTYGGTAGAGSTPTSGFITATNAATYTSTAANGISVTGNLTSGAYSGTNAITINGASGGTGNVALNGGVVLAGIAQATTGNINITGVSNSTAGILSSGAGESLTLAGNVNYIGVTNSTTGAAAVNFYTGTLATAGINATGNITVSGSALQANSASAGISVSGGNLFISTGNSSFAGYSANTTLNVVGYGINVVTGSFFKTGGDLTLSGSAGTASTGNSNDGLKLAGFVNSTGGNFTIQGAIASPAAVSNSSGTVIANAALGVAGSAATAAYYGIYTLSPATYTYGGVTYKGMNAVGNISLSGISNGTNPTPILLTGTDFITTTTGNVTINASTTTSISNATQGVAFYNTSTAIKSAGSLAITASSASNNSVYQGGTLNAVSGINVTGSSILGTSSGLYGAITNAGAVTNTGPGGINFNSTGNFTSSTTAITITDSGTGGISITGGQGIAAGTTTGGTITAVGTLVNTGGGVISLSMAQPTSPTGGTIETAAGVTTANASTASNVSYSNIGGTMGAPNAATVNSVNYRSVAQGIAVTLKASYTQPYGTAYNSVLANDWLQNPANATVTVTGSANFGATAISAAQAQASLIFAGAIGGNSNLVQTATNLDGTTSILSSLGQIVTTTGAGNTYSITPKVLTITGTQLSSTYNGVSTYENVANAGYTVAGLVTNFNLGTVASPVTGAATGNTVSSVTHVIQTGSTVLSNTAIAQACSTVNCYTDAVSAALGSGLSNYTIVYVSGTFNVAKAALSITQANTNLQGTGSTQTVTPAYSVSGLVGADAVTSLTTNTQTGTANGTYTGTISGANGVGLSNYTITYNPGTLTITSNAVITITALADTKVYGNSLTASGLTYSGSGVATFINGVGYTISGLPTGDTLTGLTLTSLGGISSASVGSNYVITPSGAAITGVVPYTLNYVTALMTVTPRPITIAATPITTTYGTPATVSQAITTGYTVGGSGLGASDTLTSVAVNYVSGGTSATTVPGTTTAATYSGAIVPSAATGTGGFNASNYTITYTPANLVVNRLAVSLTANAQSTVYGTELALGTTAYTSSLSSLPNGDTIAGVTLQYNSSATVPGTTNAQTYTGGIVASSATGTGGFGITNYAITYNPGNLTVTPANVVISPVNVSASGQTVTYNGAIQTFNPSTGFTVTGLQNGQTPVFGTTGLASATNVGTYANNITSGIITGLSSGSLSNYSISVSAQGSLTIIPAPLTITGATTNVAYSGSLQNNANPVVVGLVGIDTQVGNGVTVTGKSSGTNAGTYNDLLSVAAAGATQLSNYTITKTNGSLVISKLAATVTGATTVNPYTGLLQTNTYTTTGILSGDTANVTIAGSAAATHVSQGTVPDVFSVSGSAAGNYAFTYAPGSMTITPVALSVVGANSTQVYNANTQTNTVATITGLKASDTVTIGGSYGAGKNVGIYADALTVSLSNPSDYTIGVTNGSIAITPATITISGITANNKVYNATTAATLNVGTITYSGVFAGDTVSVNTSNLSGTFVDKNVGTAKTVNISGVVLGGSSSANYQLSGGANTTTTANITPASLTITGSDLTTTYSGAAQSLASPAVAGVIAGDNVLVSTTGGTGTNAGTYSTSYATSGIDAANYSVTSNTPTLTINKASLVISADNNGKVVTQVDPNPLSATVSGLQGADTTSSVFVSPYSNYSVSRAAGESAGPYAITVSGPTTLQNYNVTYTPGIFTIAGAGQLLVSMNAATTSYGVAAAPTISSVQYGSSGGSVLHTLTVSSQSGNAITYTDGVGGYITITPSISGATTASNVGSYSLATTNTNSGTTNAAGNFTSVLTVANTLTITPAPLTLTVADVSKTYNANAVTAAQITAGTLTGGTIGSNGVTVTGGALMNSQTIAGLGGVVYTGPAVGAINASSTPYAINGSVGSGFSNYAVTVVPGTLTVNTAPLVVNGALTTRTYSGASQTNAAATIAGLQGSDTLTIAGYATGTHAGTTADALVATGAAASNYSITYNNGALTINPAALLVTGSNNQYAYNGALQTNTGASVSGLKGSDTATVSGYATATHVAQGIIPDVLVATASNPADYAVTYVQGSLQITPIVITAAVNTAAVMYNAASQTTGFVVTGLKGADTATAASGTATGTNVGTYTSNLVLSTSSDYTVGAITNGTLTITPAPLTISAGLTANNKVYDTTNAATIGVTGNQTLAGVLGTDAVSVSSTGPYTGATFSQFNVGSDLTVTPAATSTVINGASYTTMAGVTLGGTAASNYYVAGVGPQTLTANITPAPLTISSGLTANNKAYDGTTAATISSASQVLAGVLGSDVVSVSSSGSYTGTFSQSNVGTGLAVSASTTPTTIAGGTYNAMTGVTLTGAGGAQGNYYVAGLSAPIAANITPYVINFGAGGTGPNIAAVANNKVYTSTTAASGSLSMVNLFGTDSVSVSYTSAAFVNPNVATGATVTFNGVTLSGASAANYSIGSTPVTAAANITPALLTITAVDKSSFYSQGLVTLTQAPAVGLLGSDTVTGATITTTATATGANAAVGTYPISISAATGSGLSNYSINYVPATYTIVGPGGLVIATSGVTTPYGTGTSGNILAPALPTATYTTGGANISSLTYVSSSTTGDVTSYVFRDAALNTVTFNLSPSNTTISTSNNINVGSYAYAASNLSAVATGLTSAVPSGNFTVTPLAVTITATPTTSMYNGSTQNQSAATTSPAILTNDEVNISGIASGTNVGIYGSNLSTAGADAGNYAFTYVNKNLTITPFIIGSSGSGGPSIAATANNKVYDTTTVASGALAMTNLFAGDSVSVAYANANFATPNVANSLTVTFGGVTLSGPSAANYSVASVPSATANITPAPLMISAGLTANNKVYDTTNAATIAVTGAQSLAGVLGTDVVSVRTTGPYTGATFSQSNVGSGLTVTPATSVVNGLTTMTGVTLTGSAANNYYVAGVGPQTLVANITPAPLTINAGLTANNKAYDGTTVATISSASQTLAGVLTADVVNVAVSSSGPYDATFASKNVANGITVTPNTTPTVIAGGTYNAMSGVSLTGSAASNYYVTGTTSPITANITPYIINFGAGGTGPNITALADSKVYTSTNTANGVLSMVNLFPGDSVAVSYATATFASVNVANGIAVTFNTPTLSGASAANYSIGSTAITAPANITPAPLTVTAVNQSSFYSQSLATLTQAPAVGLLGNDTVTGATITTTASTTGANASAGNYPIAISAATGSGIGNYAITYVPATYTIVAPGALMITTAGATTPYGTSTSGNIITPAQPVASYSTGGSNISPLTFVSATTAGNVTSYVYRDATSALVSFNLIPVGTTTSTSGNIVVGSYAYAASNLVSASSGLTSGSAIASGNLTVTPLAVTITAPTTAALTYNGQVQTQGPAVASPVILTNDLVTVSGAASGKNVGVYGSNLAVSGADASNYTFTLVNKNITITPYVITPGSTTGPHLTTAANNKVYDTTTAATGNLAMTGLFAGDSVAVNYSSAAFASANVNLPASPQTVTFSGVTLSGASASNYSIGSGAVTATANITPAPVTISGLVANNKVYTSTTADVISGTPIVTGLLGSDSSTATGTAVGTFASPNVANGISVAADLSGMTLSNGNYVITGLTAPLAANITPAPLTISSGLVAQSKVYDTTTAATIAAIGTQTLTGVLGSDAANLSVSSSGPYTGSFSQASVGNGLIVAPTTAISVINGQSYTTMAGVTLSGSAAGNYYVTGPTTALTANITPAPLTITAINQASFVTQPIGALTYASIGLLGSDTISTVTLATAASNIQPAGQYAITASNATGAAIGNYQVTYTPGTYTIVPAGQLLIQSSGAVTPYTTAATFANPTVAYATSSGAVINNLYLTASSTVNGITTYTYSDGAGASLSFNFAPTNPVMSGSNNVSVGNYGLSAANFAITGNNITNIAPVVTGDLTVTPRAITITATPATYVYNGTVRVLANATSAPGIVVGDLVTVTDTTAGKNVGKYFSALATTGTDARNYQTSFINANLTITPYVLGSGVGGPAISASANNRVYNTTTDATGSLAMTSLFPGDVVTANFTSASFASPNANNGTTVTFNGVNLSGAAAANYVLGTAPVTTTANITKAPVTISGLLAQNKVFDGTTAATIAGNPVIAGLLGSDVSSLSGSVLAGLFASSNPADRILVKAILDALILGNPNYYIAGVTFPLVADITAPPQAINNMAIVQQQVAQEFVQERPKNLIYKGDVIYVRDKDNMPEYMQAIEVPKSGAFKFPVPDQIVQELINLSGENVSASGSPSPFGGYKLLLLPKGCMLVVALPDGSALPSGIKFDAGTKTFAVPKLGEVTLPLSVKITLMRGNKVLSEKIMMVTK